jgi:curved DNA-binding protein CbpA
MAAKVKGKAINYYQALGVHPAAPLDLITAAYWHRAGEAQNARGSDPDAERLLYYLTKAYQTLADARTREQYDRAIGLGAQPPVPSLFRRRRGLARLLPLRRGARPLLGMPDYYEVLRVDPSADFPMIQRAYELMRNYYLRVVKLGHQPVQLLDALEDAYSVTSSPELRAKYDARVGTVRRNGQRAVVERKSAAGKKRKLTGAKAGQAKKEGVVAKAKKLGRPEKSKTEPALKPGPAARQRKESAPRVRKAQEPSLASRLAPAVGTAARLTWAAVKAVPSAFIVLVGLVVGFIMGAWGLLANVFSNEPESAPVRLDEGTEQTFLARLSWAHVQAEEAGGASNPDEGGSGRLALTDGPNSGMTYDFQGSSATIGGGSACDIRLPGLPAQSARLLCRNGRFVIYSLSDDEPIRINGDPAEWAILESGDCITIGEYTLRLETAD